MEKLRFTLEFHEVFYTHCLWENKANPRDFQSTLTPKSVNIKIKSDFIFNTEVYATECQIMTVTMNQQPHTALTYEHHVSLTESKLPPHSSENLYSKVKAEKLLFYKGK